MSAASATNAEPASAELANIVLEGSTRTYEVRDVLRGLGLRWDREAHHWHGTLPVPEKARLETELHLPVQVVGVIRPVPPAPSEGPQGPRPPARRACVNWGGKRPKDGSRTSLEAALALKGESFDEEGADGRDGRRYSALDTTSGLQDDSRAADERQHARQLADVRGRVKSARAALSAHPGAEEVLARDWVREAQFYARFGITQEQFRNGVPAKAVEASPDAWDGLKSPLDWMSEVRAREAAVLPVWEED